MTEDLQRGTRSHRRRRATTATAAALTLLLLAGACSSDEDEGAAPDVSTSTTAADAVTSCPTEVDDADFMAADEMRDLLAAFKELGLRSPGREQPEAPRDWRGAMLGAVPGREVAWAGWEWAGRGETPGGEGE